MGNREEKVIWKKSLHDIQRREKRGDDRLFRVVEIQKQEQRNSI